MRERSCAGGVPDGLCCGCPRVLWYAGERGLPGGLGREPERAECHEDGPVPVHHRRRRPAAAGAGGAPALSVGGAVSEG